MTRPLGRILPGLATAVAVAAASRALHSLLPEAAGRAVGEVVVAVALGLSLGNAVRLPAALGPGIRFSFHTVLRLAIVLLGASFSFRSVVAIGVRALGMVVVLMSVALVLAHALGRAVGVRGKLATLIGVGTSVCGNSAISASAPVIDARDEDVAFAIATNTLFGTLAVFAYPVLGRLLGLDDAAYGTWAGTAVNDTSQVVAAGFAFGDVAGRVATVVKLTRNALMGVVIVGLGLAYGRGASGGRRLPWARRVRQSLPAFVVGFLALALVNTAGALALASRAAGRDVGADLGTAARFLILVALAGVGLGTRLDAMRRIGLRPFWVGLATASAVSLTSLALIRLLGAAGG